MITVDPAVRHYLLALADDEHLMGQQHTEWIGVAPFLEEDLAFSSIAQDELGHAAMVYALLVGDDDLDIDELAYGRPPAEYRSSALAEVPTPDWAEALARHWLYDSIEALRWGALTDSSLPEVAAVAARAMREEAYHRRHADGLLDALLTDEPARRRIVEAVDALLPLALAMFEPTDDETAAVTAGVATAALTDELSGWRTAVDERFGAVTWPTGEPDRELADRTTRSAQFDDLYARMRLVFDYDPGAIW